MNHPFLDRRHFLALAGAAAVTAHSAPAVARAVCVLGATGRVGELIVQHLLGAGFTVIAISRSADKLARLAAAHGKAERLHTLPGDVASDATAQELRRRLSGQFGELQGVVASLSSSAVDGPMRILDSSTDTLRKAFETNFFSHVSAARALIPALKTGATYLGINGGLANFAGAGMAQLTTTQSALHSLYQVLALEAQSPNRLAGERPFVRVLELYGLVDDGHASPPPLPMRIDGAVLGERAAAVIANPAQFPGPVLSLKAKAFS